MTNTPLTATIGLDLLKGRKIIRSTASVSRRAPLRSKLFFSGAKVFCRTPLSWAAIEGYERVVKLLVERDDVEADSKDKWGRTPLSWAALDLAHGQRWCQASVFLRLLNAAAPLLRRRHLRV
jgi:hypothetical protein